MGVANPKKNGSDGDAISSRKSPDEECVLVVEKPHMVKTLTS
jgi:hypothetical protein